MPPELKDVLLLGLLNPAALLMGYWLGRRADQRQKAVVAGFASALAGTFFVWIMMRLGWAEARPRLLAGILIVSLLTGTAAALLGHWVRQLQRRDG